MKKICFLFICLLQLLSAKEIIDIEIVGLERTKPYIIKQKLNKYIGQNDTDIDINDVFADIKDTGILEPLNVIIENQIIKIKVKEKMSFIPLPFFATGDNGSFYGLGIIDVNAFGLGDKMMLIAAGGSGGSMFMFMFKNDPNKIGDFGWGISTFYSHADEETTNQYSDIYSKYYTKTIGYGNSISYKFTDFFQTELSVSYMQLHFIDNKKQFNVPQGDKNNIVSKISNSLHFKEYNKYFLSRKLLNFNYSYTTNNDSYSTLYLKGIYDIPFKKNRLSFKTGLHYSPDAKLVYQEEPRVSETYLLPRTFKAKNYAGVSLGYERFITQYSIGSLTFITGGQYVYSKSDYVGESNDYGIMASLQIYLTKISIPAVGLKFGYNMKRQTTQMDFNIGMGF